MEQIHWDKVQKGDLIKVHKNRSYREEYIGTVIYIKEGEEHRVTIGDFEKRTKTFVTREWPNPIKFDHPDEAAG